MKKLALHWQILIGMTAGILWGRLIEYRLGSGRDHRANHQVSKSCYYSIADGQVVTNHEVKPAKTITTTKVREWVTNWVEPFGTMFANLLKVDRCTIDFASLIKGISDLKTSQNSAVWDPGRSLFT
jgi:Na+/H+-dicarboxylate symporter